MLFENPPHKDTIGKMTKIIGIIKQKIYEKMRYRASSFGWVLMFHCVEPELPIWYSPDYSITCSSFIALINSLLENGFRFINIDDLFKKGNKKSILLTFDDGFNIYDSGIINFLETKRIPFVLFITTAFLGQEHYLSKKQVNIIAKSPLCEIGFHSRNHVMLRKIGIREQKNEVVDFSKDIAEITHHYCRSFAYPFGSFYAVPNYSIRLARREYQYAFSTINLPIVKNSSKKRWFLPRININEKNWKSSIARFIDQRGEK
jgi:peptidoglycan/xylan/chitin deacetylase (PgdA/CDA1 family)